MLRIGSLSVPRAGGAARGGGRASATPRASMFSALRYRNYRLFWLGQLISVSGSFMQGTAQQWLILTLTPNPLALGIVGALQFGPVLVLGPFGGAVADRWPRRRVLIGTQTVAGILALALWSLTALGVVQIWHVYLLALLLGIVNAVDMPTRQAFVSEMVPAEGLLNAVSLNSAQFNVSRILGPALAGVIIAVFSMPILFLLNGLSYVAVIVGLWLMRPAELFSMARTVGRGGRAQLRGLVEGARFIGSVPTVLLIMVLVGVTNTFGFNFNVLLPLEAADVLHAGPALFGVLTSALGIGALAGALLLARSRGMPGNRLLVTTMAAFAVFEMAFAVWRSVPGALLLLAATGFFMSTFSSAANTRVQLASPPEMRGRVMSFYAMLSMGTTPIGNLMLSGVASGASVPASYIVAGLPCLLCAGYAAWAWRAGQLGADAAPITVPVAAEQAQIATAATPPIAETPPLALPAPAAQPLPSPLAPPARSGSYPARFPRPAPGHPLPQPRAADAE